MVTKAYNDLASSSYWKIAKDCYLTAYTCMSIYTAVKVCKYLFNPLPENDYSRDLSLFTLIAAPYLIGTTISLVYTKITSTSPTQRAPETTTLQKTSLQEVLINQKYLRYTLEDKGIDQLKPLYELSKQFIPS